MITVNVLIAPPGCNKESLGKQYAKVNGVTFVTVQTIIKDYRKNVRNYHAEAQHWMKKDELIPTWIIYHEVLAELFKWGFKGDRVIVGFPRTKQQAEILYKTIIQSAGYSQKIMNSIMIIWKRQNITLRMLSLQMYVIFNMKH